MSCPTEHRAEAEAALEVLLDSALEPIVDMVLLHRDGAYEARAHDGSVRFRRTDGDGSAATRCSPPRASTRSPTRAPTSSPASTPSGPTSTRVRADNQYPHAFDHIAQLFDSPATPDLCVIHSARHNWEDQGGHLGEHGSLGVVQARAPFVIGGKGVRASSAWRRCRCASSTWRPPSPRCSAARRSPRQRQRQRPHVRRRARTARPASTCIDERERPRHVVGFLFDGTNPNVLYDMAARGEAPNVARIIEMGTAFGHGAIASLPTITLANHTTIITGRHPGHHGILNNAWYDRAQRRAGDHELERHLAVGDGHARARHRVDPRRGAPHLGRRASPRR